MTTTSPYGRYELRVCDESGRDELIRSWIYSTPRDKALRSASKVCEQIDFEGCQLVFISPRNNGEEYVYEGNGRWSDVSNKEGKGNRPDIQISL